MGHTQGRIHGRAVSYPQDLIPEVFIPPRYWNGPLAFLRSLLLALESLVLLSVVCSISTVPVASLTYIYSLVVSDPHSFSFQ